MNKEVEFNLTGNFLSKSNSTIGIKEYELCDHLSNVSVVILDRKDCYNCVFKPIVKTYTDYYPFGYPISSRTDNFDYRYGYNGQEGDGEIYGDNKCYSFEFRNYDSRIGRWWGIDELKNQQPNQSTYKAFNNNPILFIDNDGLKEYMTIKFVTKSGTTLTYRMHISYNIMTDGVKYEATSKISDAVWWYENRYFDYEHVVTYVENADGTFTQKGNPVTRIMTETPYKEADGVYFGGNKKGDIQYDFSEYLTDKPSGGFNFVSDDGGASPTRKKGAPNVTTVNITKIIAAFNAMAKTPGKLPNIKTDPMAAAKVIKLVQSIVKKTNELINPPIYKCLDCERFFDKDMNVIKDTTNLKPTKLIHAETHAKKQ
jgi:RHS repeat-associated protein